MGHISHEPSMEEILSSIKRIIAEDGDPPARAKRAARPQPVPVELTEEAADEESEILELTDTVQPRVELTVEPIEAAPPPSAEEKPVTAAAAPAPEFDNDLVSTATASASRQSLTTLSRLIVKPEDAAADNTLEGLVREMLRPMLKTWLDANLPDLVEAMVAKEISRITGQSL